MRFSPAAEGPGEKIPRRLYMISQNTLKKKIIHSAVVQGTFVYTKFHCATRTTDAMGPFSREKSFQYWNQVIRVFYVSSSFYRTKVQIFIPILGFRFWSFAHIYHGGIEVFFMNDVLFEIVVYRGYQKCMWRACDSPVSWDLRQPAEKGKTRSPERFIMLAWYHVRKILEFYFNNQREHSRTNEYWIERVNHPVRSWHSSTRAYRTKSPGKERMLDDTIRVFLLVGFAVEYCENKNCSETEHHRPSITSLHHSQPKSHGGDRPPVIQQHRTPHPNTRTLPISRTLLSWSQVSSWLASQSGSSVWTLSITLDMHVTTSSCHNYIPTHPPPSERSREPGQPPEEARSIAAGMTT